jgi:LmbE family N-acetylglucosaminyl deacetylase
MSAAPTAKWAELMRSLEILPRYKPSSILCVGAHSDDIEIDAGGSILGWIAAGAEIDVRWCFASSSDLREEEARTSADEFLRGTSSVELVFGVFRDDYLSSNYSQAKNWMESLARGPKPDVILTHRRDNAHQDHRLICELTWNTFRDHLILEYEIPKWDGDLGRPNVYASLDGAMLDRKINLLGRHFSSQRSKDWFDGETIRGHARLRGVECRAQYVEAFWARKMLLT